MCAICVLYVRYMCCMCAICVLYVLYVRLLMDAVYVLLLVLYAVIDMLCASQIIFGKISRLEMLFRRLFLVV
jgi:hypothetical protein